MQKIVQGSPEWHALRRNMIGASDAPVIMRDSPWKTPYQLWEYKVGITEENAPSASMKRGLDLEEKARERFCEKIDLWMAPTVIIHPEIRWMMASLDGIDVRQERILEIKCPGAEDHKIALDGKIPEKYYAQLQHQMEVSGVDMAYYFSFDGEDGAIVEVGRNTKYIREMLEEEEKFYKCMQNFLPPELVEKDYHEKSDERWFSIATEWAMLQENLIELEKRDKQLRDTLISMANGKNCVGAGVRVCKVARKGNVDYGSIKELKGVNLDQYRKEPSEFWKIQKS